MRFNKSVDNWTTCYTETSTAFVGKNTQIDLNEISASTAYVPLVHRHIIVECKK